MKKAQLVVTSILALQSAVSFAANPAALIAKTVSPKAPTKTKRAQRSTAAVTTTPSAGNHHAVTSAQHSPVLTANTELASVNVAATNNEVAVESSPATEYKNIATVFSAISKSGHANINKGNVLTGASFTLSEAWYNGSSVLNLSLTTPVQYFVVDRFALGGAFTLSHYNSSGSNGYTDVSVGPAATYYFWDSENIATYLDSSVLWRFLDRSDDQIALSFGAGVDYFITPSVAFGPKVNYTHYFGIDKLSDVNALTFAASFRIAL